MKIKVLLLAFCVLFAAVYAEETAEEPAVEPVPAPEDEPEPTPTPDEPYEPVEPEPTPEEPEHPDVELWFENVIDNVQQAYATIEDAKYTAAWAVVSTLWELESFFVDLKQFVVENRDKIDAENADLVSNIAFVLDQFTLLAQSIQDPAWIEEYGPRINEQFFQDLQAAHEYLHQAFAEIYDDDSQIAAGLDVFVARH